MKKWVDNLITGILGGFIVLLLGAEITMMVTEKKNGIPSLFGYSFLYVKTDSMVGDNPDSLAVGDGCVIRYRDPSTVTVGTVITFYDEYTTDTAKPTDELVTHRVMEIKGYKDLGDCFFCYGDNVQSSSNVGKGVYDGSLANIVPFRNYKGSLVSHSKGLGDFIKNTKQTWFMPVTVFVPLALIAVWEGVDIFREGRKAEKEEDAEIEAAMVAAGVDPKDEKTRLLYEEKFRYKIELKHEVEEAKKAEKARFAKTLAAEKKKEKARLEKEALKGDGKQ
jgi:hypothetical protein